jgi:hypothetical protein
MIATSISSLALVINQESPYPAELEELSGFKFEAIGPCMSALWAEALALQANVDLKVIMRRYTRADKHFVGGIHLNTIPWTMSRLQADVAASRVAAAK